MPDEQTSVLERTNMGSLDEAAKRLLGENSEEPTPEEEPETVAEEATEEEVVAEETSEEYEEEESEEYEEVEEEEEEETEVEEEEPSYFTVKVDGEELEVTLDELTSGYQRQGDYTRKTQALAEQRKDYETRSAELQQLQENYLEQATLANELLNRGLKQFDNVDWNNLKETDPQLYMQKKLELQEMREEQTQLHNEIRQNMERSQKAQHTALQQELQKQWNETLRVFPAWKDEGKAKTHQSELREYGLSLGFSEQELSNIGRARDLVLLDKAMKYDNMQKTKEGIKGKKKAPAVRKKVVKKGPAPKNSVKVKHLQESRGKLRKSGSLKDAAAFMNEMRESKVIKK
jgi:hypothetical protein